MPKTEGNGVPGRYHKQFRVDHAIPSVKTAETTGDLAAMDWLRAENITQTVTYIGDLERWDGKWTLVVQWVDLDEVGHRIVLPHGVVERVIAHADAIKKLARSDRSRVAAATRRGETETPEFPTYIGDDGQEHGEY